ncbi:MAG: glycoside hydrolase, partial [Anaerolineaceae bacterium]|nr:glycoside hydrolase [Anaerolineaceae bacterium]
MNKPNPGNIQRVHLIFKTHLDVGFTDFSAKVVENYFKSYIPRAIDLARLLRESGSSDRFIWTTGSWLIYEYLELAGKKERREMEEAIAHGDITWHALPFTMHSENLDTSLFRYGLSLSQELDKRFGHKTIAAKMTDVPGHTRGIIPLLEEAGVQFLHIGVNGASTPPDVPPVFIWRDPNGAEIMVMYHKGSYGDLMIVPGCTDAIAFAHTGDNLGPQSVDELYQSYRMIRGQFPGCKIQASTMDAFATQLVQKKNGLPIIENEIGDTWIHGAGTDPKKEAGYRELSRLRRQWLKRGVAGNEIKEFS